MKFILSITTALILAFFSCKNKNDSIKVAPTNGATITTTSDEDFYPITQYIQQQFNYLDSTPLAIEKQVFVNNHRIDSSTIDRVTFKEMAKDFYAPDLNDIKQKPLYTESKFNDQTINTLTFSYNAKDPAQEIQQRDILLDPETQKVRNVMFRKVAHIGDTTFTINGLWKHNMNFQLNYIIEPANGPMQTKQIKVIWDRPVANN